MSLLSDALLSEVSGGSDTGWCVATLCITHCDYYTITNPDGTVEQFQDCYDECYDFTVPCDYTN